MDKFYNKMKLIILIRNLINFNTNNYLNYNNKLIMINISKNNIRSRIIKKANFILKNVIIVDDLFAV